MLTIRKNVEKYKEPSIVKDTHYCLSSKWALTAYLQNSKFGCKFRSAFSHRELILACSVPILPPFLLIRWELSACFILLDQSIFSEVIDVLKSWTFFALFSKMLLVLKARLPPYILRGRYGGGSRPQMRYHLVFRQQDMRPWKTILLKKHFRNAHAEELICSAVVDFRLL